MENQGGHEELPNSLLGKTMDLLHETNSDPVIDITQSLPEFPPVLLARFRNGSLQAGIKLCNIDMSGSPSTNYSQRDSVFKDAKQRWGDQYTEKLADALSSIDDEHVKGALRLAGYLAQPDLVTGLEDCWDEYQNTPELLPAFLWASFQCCIPEHPSLLDQIFGQWATLPSGNSIDNETEEISKGDVYSEVKFSITRDISDPQVRYLISATETFPDLEHHLSLLLSKISDPDALELVIRKRGENMREIDGLSPWGTHLLDPWRPDSPHGQSLPPEPKERMKNIWLDDNNIDEVRSSAFQLWARNAQAENIGELKCATHNDLFKPTVFRYLLKLGDREVITSSSLDFVEYPTLLGSLPNAWCSEAYDVVNNLLSQNSPDESGDLFYHLGGMLFDIPQDDSEKLLKIHWDKVSDQPKFFQAALYTATSDTIELAASAYDAAETPDTLLNHVRMNFGFNTYGRSELISKQHLVSLEPYLEDISDMDLIHIAEKANELGMEDWGTDHIQPLLSTDYRQNHYPTDEDILRELDDLREKEDVVREINGWMIRFKNRAESKSRAFRILEDWIQEDPTIDGYRMVAEVIKSWGTRDELSILENTDLKDDHIEQYYRDAKFAIQVRTLK